MANHKHLTTDFCKRFKSHVLWPSFTELPFWMTIKSQISTTRLRSSSDGKLFPVDSFGGSFIIQSVTTDFLAWPLTKRFWNPLHICYCWAFRGIQRTLATSWLYLDVFRIGNMAFLNKHDKFPCPCHQHHLPAAIPQSTYCSAQHMIQNQKRCLAKRWHFIFSGRLHRTSTVLDLVAKNMAFCRRCICSNCFLQQNIRHESWICLSIRPAFQLGVVSRSLLHCFTRQQK